MAEDVSELWRTYRRTGDQALRDRLILMYAPLVKYVAGRLGSGLPAHVDEGDLVSYGLLGLIRAIERYDPDRDVKFETYAIARIKGSIIDELRALDWVPRSVRSRAREIERAMAELEAKLHARRPTRRSPRRSASRSEELEDSLTDISRSSIAALDELWTISGSGGDQVALIDTIEDTSRAAAAGGARRRPSCARRSPTRSRACPSARSSSITLYYYEELTLREIGEVLGVTESRVSQLHTKAILRLKARLAGAAAAPRLAAELETRSAANDRRQTSQEDPACRPRARKDPQRRRRRPPRNRKDVARRGDAVPGRRGQPARHHRGGNDRLRLGRGRAAAADVARATLCHLEWQDRKINLIDTPGDAGFQGDTIAALRVVEGALVVVSGVMGVEVRHGRTWSAPRRRPRRACSS